jgi:chromosome segregation ATPase
MRISQMIAPLAVATLMLTGCGNKQPATQAVAQAEGILGGLRSDASVFAPDELKIAEATLADMKANLGESDYKAVVEEVPKFNTELKTLKDTIVSKQNVAAAAQHEWDELNAQVPKTVEALQVRVDALTGTRLPKEITKETFESAKTDLETMKTEWAAASAAATEGKIVEAADKGRTVAAKGEELKNELGMNPSLASTAPTMSAPAGADISPAN